MKILSGRIASMAVPGCSPMYASAACMPARFTRSGSSAGSGTCPSMGWTISGEVPQLTMGFTVVASISIVLSKCASSSLTRVRQ
ncbi:hypothetical protein D3C81_2189300 [compost metagenome]